MCPSWQCVPKLIGILVLSMAASGCSLIGLAVGTGVDAARAKAPRPVATTSVARLRSGQIVTLVMADGSRITGRTLGLEHGGPPSHVRIARKGRRGASTADTVDVSLAEVSYILLERSHPAARTGFFIGLCADAATLAAVVVFIGLLVASGGVARL